MRWRLSRLNLSYGLGELVIVVAGVLIALAVDQWNDGRLARIEERTIVERLISELNTDLAGLDSEALALDSKESSLHRVRSILLDTDNPINDPEAFLRDIIDGANYGWNQFAAQHTTFDELLGSGKFGLIQDAFLREGIASYYAFDTGRQRRIDARETQYPEISYWLVPRKNEGLFEDGFARSFEIEPDLSDVSIDRLLTDVRSSDLGTHVSAEINLARFVRNLSVRMRDICLDLIERLEAYRQTI